MSVMREWPYGIGCLGPRRRVGARVSDVALFKATGPRRRRRVHRARTALGRPVSEPLHRLTRLFRELGVPTQDAEMGSFSGYLQRCGLVWSSGSPLAQPRNTASVRPSSASSGRSGSLRTSRGLGASRRLSPGLRGSKGFLRHYLVPMAASLWVVGHEPGEPDVPAARVLGSSRPRAHRSEAPPLNILPRQQCDVRRRDAPDSSGAAQLGVGACARNVRGPDHVRVRDDRDVVHAFDAVVMATARRCSGWFAEPPTGTSAALVHRATRPSAHSTRRSCLLECAASTTAGTHKRYFRP